MTGRASPDEYLRAQIKHTTNQIFSTAPIEARIAAALRDEGRFHSDISSAELALIMRNIVFTLFSQQKFAGLDVGLVHNVPVMNVRINSHEADVSFIVHIHKPIVAFLEFAYVLVNGEDGIRLSLKEDSLQVKERTRRLDLKAKAALTAINVRRIALHELCDLTGVIIRTLPPQLQKQGLRGQFTCVELALQDGALNVMLEGEFEPL